MFIIYSKIIKEYMYCKFISIIFIFLKSFLPDCLGVVYVISLIFFFLQYKYFVAVGAITPKNNTIAQDRMYVGKINHSQGVW